MNIEKPNNEYIITYSNYFYFEGVKLAFRNKELFDIKSTPIYIPFNLNSRCWIVKRKHLTISKAKELIIKEPVNVDVSHLQWYQQEQLNGVFNLEKNN